ncbi:hypothetical protein H4582DRAFT_2062295 [Lactarius indigo]|nr:hypothetical protein H4582DRAFT_2062295 [Lactarius indigo]
MVNLGLLKPGKRKAGQGGSGKPLGFWAWCGFHQLLSFAGVEAAPWVSRVREPLAPARAFAGSVSVWPVLPPLWANRHYSPSVDGQSWLVEAGEEESGARREWQASRVLGVVRVHQLSLLQGVETSLGDLDLHTGDHGVDAPTLLCPLTTLDRPLGAGHDSESEWRGLADEVNGYISIAGDDRGDDPHQCEEAVEKRELDADDLAVEPNSVAERR